MSAPIDQAAVQAELQKVLTSVQALWGNENPDERTMAVAKLLFFVSTLSDPANTEKLNRLINYVFASGDKADVLGAVLDSDVDSSEFQFVKFVLGVGSNELPSWWETVIKASDFGRAESNNTQPSAAPKPKPAKSASKPQQTAPAPESPQDLLDKLRATQPTPDPVPDATSKSTPPADNGQRKQQRIRRR